MSVPSFVAMFQGPAQGVGRFYDSFKGPDGTWGCPMSFHRYWCKGLYALDAAGRPWAFAVDNFIDHAPGPESEKDPERLFVWVPL